MDAMDTDAGTPTGMDGPFSQEEGRSSPPSNSLPPSLPELNSFSSTPLHSYAAVSSPIEQSIPVVLNNVPGFRYKYPEAAPTPPGVDDISWNKLYTAADSRMYNKHGKDATSSRKYRMSGETRVLALVMMEEKKKKEAAGIAPRAKAKAAPSQRDFPLSSRDGTPSADHMTMTISEKIKAEGRARKTSVGPSSTGGTPQPSSLGVREFVKKGVAKASRPSHKKRKLDHNPGTPSSSARASQTPVPMTTDAASEYDSDASSRSGTLYCICKRPDDHSLMIECVGCQGWFHPPCMKITLEDVRDELVDRFVCPSCTTDTFMTNFKRICRLYNVNEGCRRPARVNDNPPNKPSKYCSDECRHEFWEHVASLLRKDNTPSMGGAISRYEVANLLAACPTAAAFHTLGRKPKLVTETDSEHPLGLKFLSESEDRLIKGLRDAIAVKEKRIVDYQNQQKLLKMVNERAKRAMQYLGREPKAAICGYDYRLCFNIEEFIAWFESDEAKTAFATGILGPITDETREAYSFLPPVSAAANGSVADEVKGICLHAKNTSKKCKHNTWRELHNQEFSEHINECRSKIAAMEREIVDRIERAETREATALYYADNRTKYWSNPSDPLPGN